MKAITANWFECKVRLERVQENGLQKKVTEQFVVDALSFSEAEARITEEVGQYTDGFEIAGVKKASYKEVFFEDDPLQPKTGDDHWYKAKLEFITVDEKTEKEKRSAVTYLVQATSLHNALDNIDVVMNGSMIDYVQANVGETKILDVFLHKLGADNIEKE